MKKGKDKEEEKEEEAKVYTAHHPKSSLIHTQPNLYYPKVFDHRLPFLIRFPYQYEIRVFSDIYVAALMNVVPVVFT